ncbi:neuferricin [Zophobas morio]|mgnify:CR=1 FL=1|uniref:neuferricin n=1 Tax=Zophobas morio TaxID=2755281 RepID=UPI003083E910
MFVKIALVSIFFALLAFYYPSFVPFLAKFAPQKPNPKNSRLFTPEELQLYNGNDKPELYLAVLGKIFDVSKGSKHYGPGKAYNFFVGKDASRSFITGKFGDNDVDDRVSDLSQEELRSLNHWVGFYGKEYKRVGKLIGSYYDKNGELTGYGREVKKLIEVAELAKNNQDLDKIKYPPCNVEWGADTGTRVWCSNKSGGVTRDWVGVPRQLYQPGQDYRCACVQTPELSANLKEYEGCDSTSESCFVKT